MTPQPTCFPSLRQLILAANARTQDRSYARSRSERLPLCRVVDVYPSDSRAESLACFEVHYERRVSPRTKPRVEKAQSTSRRTETARLLAAALAWRTARKDWIRNPGKYRPKDSGRPAP